MMEFIQNYEERLSNFKTEKKRLAKLYVEQTKDLAKTKSQLEDVTTSIHDIQDYIEVLETESTLRKKVVMHV